MNALLIHNPQKYYLLALLSGILFFASWPPIGFPFILFITFAPLFFINSNELTLGQYYSVILLFCVISVGSTCYWVLINGHWWYLIGIVWQALLMTLPFLLFYKMKNKFSEPFALFAFLSAWISYEFIALHFNYNFPWLLLGNGFAHYPKYVQWYEYTGVLGGSTWIVAINILIYLFIKLKQKMLGMVTICFIAIPIICSILLYNNTTDNGKKIEVVIVQPNFNPLTEKFPDGKHYIPFEKQMSILTGLANAVATPETKIVVFPETAIIQGVWDDDIEDVMRNKKLDLFFKKHPNINLLTGIEVYASASAKENSIFVPTRFEENIGYHELFNSTLLINPSKGFTLQHKCKLLPFSERVPYTNLKIVNNLCSRFKIDNGITADKFQKVLTLDDGVKVAPVICYESLFGSYVTNYVKKGANIIFILSNDGWWGESAGHKQHFSYARLRAIENRRSVVRSANTGISAIINKRGDILASIKSFKREALRSTVTLNNKLTVYTMCGDYLGFLFMSITLFIGGFYYTNTTRTKQLSSTKNN